MVASNDLNTASPVGGTERETAYSQATKVTNKVFFPTGSVNLYSGHDEKHTTTWFIYSFMEINESMSVRVQKTDRRWLDGCLVRHIEDMQRKWHPKHTDLWWVNAEKLHYYLGSINTYQKKVKGKKSHEFIINGRYASRKKRDLLPNHGWFPKLFQNIFILKAHKRMFSETKVKKKKKLVLIHSTQLQCKRISHKNGTMLHIKHPNNQSDTAKQVAAD